LSSYCGAQIFEAIGLEAAFVEKYFTSTASRLGGIGADVVAEEVLMRHQRAYNVPVPGEADLESGGEYQWRRDGEFHLFNPETVYKLQHATRSGQYSIYRQYAKAVNDQSQRLGTLRGLFEFNYYHALLEILAKLPILDRHVSPSTPVVISPALAQQPFFQTLKALPNLRERNWIVQDDFYIAADQIWVCAIIRAARPTLQGLLGLLGDPPTASGNERRIFLTRDRSRGRCLLNFDTLQPILQAHGFEIVDTEQMPVLEQMKLFADSRVVAGIHGAGLTNLLFRAGHAANLLEIYPPHDADPSFYLLSKDLGFGWNHIIGQSPTSKQRHANFQLDPHGLSKQLDQLEATG